MSFLCFLARIWCKHAYQKARYFWYCCSYPLRAPVLPNLIRWPYLPSTRPIDRRMSHALSSLERWSIVFAKRHGVLYFFQLSTEILCYEEFHWPRLQSFENIVPVYIAWHYRVSAAGLYASSSSNATPTLEFVWKTQRTPRRHEVIEELENARLCTMSSRKTSCQTMRKGHIVSSSGQNER